MKGLIVSLFFVSFILTGFAQDKTSNSFNGLLQIKSVKNSERKSCMTGGWKKLDISSNSGEIKEIQINDTITIGVEVSIHDLEWKQDLLTIVDVHFYTKSKDGNWQLKEDKGEFIETLRVGESIPFRGWVYENNKAFFRLDLSLKFSK